MIRLIPAIGMLALAIFMAHKVWKSGVEQHAMYCKMAADSIASNADDPIFAKATASWKKFQIEDGCL